VRWAVWLIATHPPVSAAKRQRLFNEPIGQPPPVGWVGAELTRLAKKYATRQTQYTSASPALANAHIGRVLGHRVALKEQPAWAALMERRSQAVPRDLSGSDMHKDKP